MNDETHINQRTVQSTNQSLSTPPRRLNFECTTTTFIFPVNLSLSSLDLFVTVMDIKELLLLRNEGFVTVITFTHPCIHSLYITVKRNCLSSPILQMTLLFKHCRNNGLFTAGESHGDRLDCITEWNCGGLFGSGTARGYHRALWNMHREYQENYIRIIRINKENSCWVCARKKDLTFSKLGLGLEDCKTRQSIRVH